MVGMFVLTIALMGMAILTGSVIQGNQHSDKSTEAATIAQEKIEFFKHVDYSNIVSGSDTLDGFSRSWNVTTDSPGPNMKIIDMKVTWRDIQNNSQEIVVSTIMTDN